MELECSDPKRTVDSELNRGKTSWENTGRESSLCRWSSITETIQFAESDSSGHTDNDPSFLIELDEGRGEELSASSSPSTDSHIRTESNIGEIHEGYSQDEFELDYSFEVYDESESSGGEIREEFLNKKLQILTSKKSGLPVIIARSEPNCVSREPGAQTEYCKNKIHLLKNKVINDKEKNEQEINVKSPRKTKWQAAACQLENTRNFERLKIHNILHKMKKESSVPVHQPRKCKQCRELQEKLSEESYIKKKTELLKQQQFEKDIERHLFEKDSATLIAEILDSGPKPSDSPKEIWDRLLRKGESS